MSVAVFHFPTKMQSLQHSFFTFFLVFSLVCIGVTRCTLEPNLCDEKRTTQCDEYTVCCPLGDEQYGCCPFTGGSCCPGHKGCCPAGFSCTDTGSCRRTTASEK